MTAVVGVFVEHIVESIPHVPDSGPGHLLGSRGNEDSIQAGKSGSDGVADESGLVISLTSKQYRNDLPIADRWAW